MVCNFKTVCSVAIPFNWFMFMVITNALFVSPMHFLVVMVIIVIRITFCCHLTKKKATLKNRMALTL